MPLDTSAIPAVDGENMIPLRLIAESDYGSASWFEEENNGWFYLEGGNITVNFADNSITVGDELVKSKATVVSGVTFVDAGVLELLEGNLEFISNSFICQPVVRIGCNSFRHPTFQSNHLIFK